MPRPDRVLTGERIAVYWHPLAVRLTHWVNALCLLVLITSGLQILNAHPALYWGAGSTFDHPFISFGSGDSAPFPGWITLPSWQDLASGRRWHFFFAWILVINGLVYIANLIGGRHIRDLLPTLADLRAIPHTIAEHLKLRFPKGDAALSYNVLQKLAYLSVVIAFPILILAGLTMSPAMDSAFPWLVPLFGGRQSARAVHFLVASYLVLFVLVHLVMVLISGVFNNLRSMVTGRYRIEEETP